jgi:hypothetical protein
MAEADTLALETKDTPIETQLANKLSYSQRYMRDFNQNNWEYVKLLAGKPLTVFQKKNDKGENLIKPLSTGSLAAGVEQLTRHAVQGSIATELKTSSSSIDSTFNLIKYIVEDIILTDSTGNPSAFTNKLKQVFKESCAYGFSPVYTSFEKNLSGEPEIRMKIRDYGNVFPEPDKDHISEINWCFTRLWYSKADIESMKDAWGEEVCEELIRQGLQQKMGSPDERDSDDLQVSYAWQVGYPIYVYQEKNKNADVIYYSQELGKIIYQHKNYDPTGSLRTHFLIHRQDSSGALGRSLFENLRVIQEAEDEELQLAHWSTILELDPPIGVNGRADSPVYMRPGAVNWFQQGSTTNLMRTTNMSPDAVASSMKMLAGVVTNVTGIEDMSIPSANNQAGLSKTDTGVKQQQAILDTVTNSYDEELKAFLSQYIVNAFNVFVNYSKAAGIKKIFIKDFEKLQLMQDLVIEDNYVELPFDELTLDSVEVTVGPSDFGSTSDKMEALRYILNIINSAQGYNPVLASMVQSAISLLNLDDNEQLLQAIDEWKKDSKERNDLNNQQSQLQLQQMSSQLQDHDKQAPAQEEQMKVQSIQGSIQERIAPLQLQLQEVQLQLQIKQATMQLEQMNNPEATAQMQQPGPQEGGNQ